MFSVAPFLLTKLKKPPKRTVLVANYSQRIFPRFHSCCRGALRHLASVGLILWLIERSDNEHFGAHRRGLGASVPWSGLGSLTGYKREGDHYIAIRGFY
jgi:hypothetical protein